MGDEGVEIDYVELFGVLSLSKCNSCNFVFCFGGVYDCLFCGIGMSVKLVCLVVDSLFVEGEIWW